jgi:hypothetical protein
MLRQFISHTVPAEAIVSVMGFRYPQPDNEHEFAVNTAGVCQTKPRDEFPERPGCAIKGMGLETDGKLCLNGGLLARTWKRMTFCACSAREADRGGN